VTTPEPKTTLLDQVALLALSLTVFLGKPLDYTLPPMDSSTYARLALDATRHPGIRLPIGDLRTGDGFWPTGFNDHPFTLIWLSGKLMRLIGANAFSARILSALMATLCIFGVYYYGKRALRSSSAGLLATLMLFTSPIFFSNAAAFQLDSSLLAGIVLSFLGYLTGSLPLTVAGTVVAVWVKGPLGFLVYPSVLLYLLITRNRERAAWKKFLIFSLAGVGAGSLIWVAIGTVGGWDLVYDYWRRWIWGQVAMQAESSNLGTFGIILRKNFLWVGWLFLTFYIGIRKRLFRLPEFTLPLIGAGIVFLLVFLMKAKFQHYYLPCFPLLALCAAVAFREFSEKYSAQIRIGIFGLGMILPAFLLATPTPLGVERFPQLRRWTPFIQQMGTCRDRIVLLDSEIPYGSIKDYAAVLEFYTNRETYGVPDCSALKTAIENDRRVAWVILSERLYQSCFPITEKSPLTAYLRFGSQILLSRYSKGEKALDLAPLQNELQAVKDCETPEVRGSSPFRH